MALALVCSKYKHNSFPFPPFFVKAFLCRTNKTSFKYNIKSSHTFKKSITSTNATVDWRVIWELTTSGHCEVTPSKSYNTIIILSAPSRQCIRTLCLRQYSNEYYSHHRHRLYCKNLNIYPLDLFKAIPN